MKFLTFGEKGEPVAVLIHAMFISEKMFYTITKSLENSHFVILPTLDAHSLDEHTTFYSVANEANKIADYLIESGMQNIDILLGTSLGGIIAFELFRKKKISVSNVFLDGTPFIRFSNLRINIMGSIFKLIAHKSAKLPNRRNILDKLFPIHADEMKKICGNMSDESINNLVYACYSYELPAKIELTSNQTLTFLYSTNERASICIHSVEKFTNCRLVIKDGYKHCEFLSKEPQAYTEMLLNTAKENGNDIT